MDEDVEVPHLEALSVWGLPHMNNKYRCESRRATPWEDNPNATPVEKFIDGALRITMTRSIQDLVMRRNTSNKRDKKSKRQT